MGNDYEAFVGPLETAAVSVGATSGPYELIAAHTTRKTRILGFCLHCKSAGDVNFQASSTGLTLSGPMVVADGGVIQEPVSPYGPFRELAPGEEFWVNFSAAAAAGGWVRYKRL